MRWPVNLMLLSTLLCGCLPRANDPDELDASLLATIPQIDAQPLLKHRMFFTSPIYSGAQTVTFADAACAGDSANPDVTADWKALLATVDRQPGTADWPLQKNSQYVRADGLIAFLLDGLSNITFLETLDDASTLFWTGLDASISYKSSASCSDWTVTTGTGGVGRSDQIGNGFFWNGARPCATALSLLCIEQ